MAGAATGLRTGFSLGIGGFLKGLVAAKIEYDRRAKRAVQKGALLLKREIVKELSKKGTGRTYELYKPRRTHVASAEGQPPAVDFGRLKASIEEEVEKELFTWIARVGTNLKVGREKWNLGILLEFGTSKIEARPFFRPALARIRPQLAAIFAKELAG